MHKIKQLTGEIADIYSRRVELKESFLDLASRFASLSGTTVLMSGGGQDSARYNIIAAKPWLTITAGNRQTSLKTDSDIISLHLDPFTALQRLLRTYKSNYPASPAPIAAGFFGYLAYDLKDCLEDLPRTGMNDLDLPLCFFSAPALLIVQDLFTQECRLYITVRRRQGQLSLKEDLDFFQGAVQGPCPVLPKIFRSAGTWNSNFDRSLYIDSIDRIREYIAAGHVYQVNLSQRFSMDFKGNAFSLFRYLFSQNPAPFFAFLNCGDHQVVSTSPERFLSLRGRKVETRPIKGTRPRGENQAGDDYLAGELKESDKDDAELSMIVDLMRNDLGRVCRTGSIEVAEHKRIEKYRNVFHLVSIIQGDLPEDKDAVDLLQAAFPGGSITGCPKVRAMEIIDEMEPHRRHIYTGSIGYLSFQGDMDLSIAIRTATIYKEKILFSVGGGIVFDSDPEEEYMETLHKGQNFLDLVRGNESEIPKTKKIWFNGLLVPENEARIGVTEVGFQYGYGLFETVRVDKGRIHFLKDHLQRLQTSWKELFGGKFPDLDWSSIIKQTIQTNELLYKTAAVKIMACKAEEQGCSGKHLIVTARAYTHRLGGSPGKGLNLITYPEPRQTPLADHKTMNHLYYHLAGKWAAEKGADEALILNPNGSISETNSANILIIRDRNAILPVSRHVLPGITIKKLYPILKQKGYLITERVMTPEELIKDDQIIVCNSLLGAAGAESLNDMHLYHSPSLIRELNVALGLGI